MNIADLIEDIIRTPHPFAVFMSEQQLDIICDEMIGIIGEHGKLAKNCRVVIMGLPVLTVKRMPPGLVVVAGSQYNPMKGGDRGVSR